jgi:hypothetical protein
VPSPSFMKSEIASIFFFFFKKPQIFEKMGNEGVQRKLHEFLAHEKAFAGGLKMVMDHYATPLAAKSAPLPEDRYKEVFANIDELSRAHTELLSELELLLRCVHAEGRG